MLPAPLRESGGSELEERMDNLERRQRDFMHHNDEVYYAITNIPRPCPPTPGSNRNLHAPSVDPLETRCRPLRVNPPKFTPMNETSQLLQTRAEETIM